VSRLCSTLTEQIYGPHTAQYSAATNIEEHRKAPRLYWTGKPGAAVTAQHAVAIFTTRRNARIASAVLAMAIPSVRLSVCPSVRLSVTRQYCVKRTERRMMQFALSDSKMCIVL